MPRAPLRVMLVEDEAPARETMRGLLARDPDVELVGESWGARAVDAIRSAAPELIFLDVRMPRMDGFEVLRALDPDRLPVVVFVTAHEEHAVEAFEVRALDYVLKPFTDERFVEALARAKERVRGPDREALRTELLALVGRVLGDSIRGLAGPGASAGPADDADRTDGAGPSSSGDPSSSLGPAEPARALGTAGSTGSDRLVLEDGGTTIVLPPTRIAWLEASGPYVVIHAEGREYLVRTSLTTLEERLATHGFVRVHRSAVVGLDHVREVRPLSHGDALIVLRDGARVKLSRSRRARFEERLRSGS